MSPRPSRFELVSKFFPELKEAIGTDRDSLKKYSTLSCEVVLADQINEFDKGFLKYGPGVLAVRIHDGANSATLCRSRTSKSIELKPRKQATWVSHAS